MSPERTGIRPQLVEEDAIYECRGAVPLDAPMSKDEILTRG